MWSFVDTVTHVPDAITICSISLFAAKSHGLNSRHPNYRSNAKSRRISSGSFHPAESISCGWRSRILDKRIILVHNADIKSIVWFHAGPVITRPFHQTQITTRGHTLELHVRNTIVNSETLLRLVSLKIYNSFTHEKKLIYLWIA